LGRAGKLLACHYEAVKPDIITLAKSLSGGFYPVSAVLCDNHIMEVINPGDHGSTFGGNPLAASVAKKSLSVMFEDNMFENSEKMGAHLLKGLSEIKKDFIKEVRGKGLFIGFDLIENDKVTGRDFVLRLMKKGVLTNTTKKHVVRVCPPLIIKKPQVERVVEIFKKVADSY